MPYLPVIGLEIHCELKTESKMFCSCKNGLGLEKEPNINICPICAGHPGTLPVPNKKALEQVIKAGLALNCKIAQESKFDRKNYFYPDLPKGYQISQFDQPLCENGYLILSNKRKIKITRIHIEEDTGKLNHELNCAHSLVDLNRAGAPLMELVTNPDIRGAQEAKEFCQELQKILRYLDISDADMEKGQMRCEANISIMPIELEETFENFGTKVEVKNLNSFKSVERAIIYEIQRQSGLLDEGKKVTQETRGWDDGKQATYPQRTKETSADYRYFPEPDIPPLVIEHLKDDPQILSVPAIKRTLPELPAAKEQRFIEEYQMDAKDAEIITADKDLAEYMEGVISELKECRHNVHPKDDEKKIETEQKKLVKMATGWFVSKLFKLLNDHQAPIKKCRVTPENFAELIIILYQQKINSNTAQMVLEDMFNTGSDPEHIIQEKNLAQTEDESEITRLADKILKESPQQVEQYKKGKKTVLQFLVGQVMKESKGKANPEITAKILSEKLKE
ncbi:MAG: Asp-tRNA(Asn)/Glu-tRNA(Gln) amidotransferase subunit GatB [Parcubacteria group bacterium]|nr:Asp-tRNA(Asn)/Glu-tRNA(Gln) amidotransferase subunit GatB [Parcubacteria group bacterium]